MKKDDIIKKTSWRTNMDNYINERIEWSRVWREDSEKQLPRVLLIGDSIIDGSKHNIYERLLGMDTPRPHT